MSAGADDSTSRKQQLVAAVGGDGRLAPRNDVQQQLQLPTRQPFRILCIEALNDESGEVDGEWWRCLLEVDLACTYRFLSTEPPVCLTKSSLYSGLIHQ